MAGLGLAALAIYAAASWRSMAVSWEARKLAGDLELIPAACKAEAGSISAEALKRALAASFEARRRVVLSFVEAAEKAGMRMGGLKARTYCYAALAYEEKALHVFTCRYRSSVHFSNPLAAEDEPHVFWPWLLTLPAETYKLPGKTRVLARVVTAGEANTLGYRPWLGKLSGESQVCLLENELYEITLENLLRLFQSSNRDTRGQAALLFGKLGAAAVPAIPVLLATLEAEAEDARMAAAEALARLGPHAAAAFPEILRIADEHEGGFASLAIYESPARSELLSLALSPKSDVETRDRAISYIATHDDDSFDPHKFLPQLVSMASEPDPIGAAARSALEVIWGRNGKGDGDSQ